MNATTAPTTVTREVLDGLANLTSGTVFVSGDQPVLRLDHSGRKFLVRVEDVTNSVSNVSPWDNTDQEV